MDIATATQALITRTAAERGVDRAETIFAGSSKGGFAALYHGYLYGCGHIVAGGPQVLLGTYLNRPSPRSVLPPILKYLAGEVSMESEEWANGLLLSVLRGSVAPYPAVHIHVGAREPHYVDHVIPFLEWVRELGITGVETDLADYDTHQELAQRFPAYLRQRVSEVVSTPLP
jgi:hypothetical protein